MDFVNQLIKQLAEHFRSLTLSQRLVYILLVVLIVISGVWTVVWTAQPEMVPLLDQSFSDAQIARIENLLDMWDITYKVEGGRVYVRRVDQNRLLARLQLAGALPMDTSEGWRKLILEADMWLPADDRAKRWQLAREQRLADVIRMMDGVLQAQVIVNTGSKRLLSGGPSSDPSASVYIKMQPGFKPSRNLVDAVADLVSGAVDRLERDRVKIIIDGVPYRVSSEDAVFSEDILDARRRYEKHFGEKIVQVLGIPNALVGVFVELETETVKTEEQKFGDPVISKERIVEDISEEPIVSGEPGVRPNTGASIGSSPTLPLNKSSRNETETEYRGARDVKTVVRHNLPGTVRSIRATVNVPMSYFVQVYKEQTGKSEEPKPQDLDPIIKKEIEAIRKKVMPIINAASIDDVEVSWYYDTIPTSTEAMLASTAPSRGIDLISYAKPAGLIVLAFSSLMMVLLMLRKVTISTISVADAKEAAKAQPPTLQADTGPVGEADTTEGFLEAIEVDERVLKAKNMAEQVANMVREDPAVAANLIKKWIIKDNS